MHHCRKFISCVVATFLGLSLGLNILTADPGFAYRVEAAFGGLSFQSPTQLVFAPDERQRAFVVELGGRVALIRDLNNPTREVFLDLSGIVGNNGPDHGALSLAFHPRFAQNGQFFLWYSLVQNGQRHNRLSRFNLLPSDPNRADPASELPFITQKTGRGGHDGGMLLFGADGYLYLSIGDGDTSDPDAAASHQRIDRSFFGAVLRIDVDKKAGNLAPNPHASINPGTYSVPADNPFVAATSFNGQAVTLGAVRTEFWAVGLRNPFRMSFDGTTGQLWCGDVGLLAREEIDLITKGSNYGWDFREGTLPGASKAAPPTGVTFVEPIWEYGRDLGLSVTGGVVYRGARFPELEGAYLFSDFLSGRIWTLVDNGVRPLPATQIRQIATQAGIVNFTIDPRNGDLLLVDLLGGVIRRLAPDAGNDPSTSRLINLSTRGLVGRGDQVLIPGFIISGSSKTVLVRAAGPGLRAFGLNGVLDEPILTLHQASGVVAVNRGWENSPNLAELKTAITSSGAFPFAAGSTDSAILVSLSPGAYTAIVEGASGGTGVALVELYEVNGGAGGAGENGRFVNMSARVQVNTGESILIAGLIIGGTAPRTMLVRAAGPALNAFGINSFLNRPLLKLFTGNQQLASNAGWNQAPNLEDLRQAMKGPGFAFAEGSADSAMLVTLHPGAYTLQISGGDGGTGVALVEIYEVAN